MKKTIDLLKELNHQGIRPKLWLRDDDICTDSPNFRLLLQLSNLGFPMVFAAVPYRLKFSDAELNFVRTLPKNVYIAVHGFNHINRSVQGRISEYPETVTESQACKEFTYGVNKVKTMFPERFFPMFVPPWNYISDVHVKSLEKEGIKYLSGTVDIALNTSGTNIQDLPSHVDVLAYGQDIWFPLKLESQIDNEVFSALNAWKEQGDYDLPFCILSHHTSMISKDISRFKVVVNKISPHFRTSNLQSPFSSSDDF